MAAAEPPPSTGMGFLGMLSFRRSATAVASFDPAQEDELQVLDALQAHVADRLAALSSHVPVLSLAFLSKLLDAVLSSDAAFRDVLAVGAPVAAALARPPADRLAADLLDRAVKALDVLNAVSLSLASLKGSHRAALTAASCILATPPHLLHRAHFARARRAIAKLFPDAAAVSRASSAAAPSSRAGRALSFSVSSKNWSAGRHVHALAAHLAPLPQGPASPTPGAGNGLGLAVYTMSSVLVFAMWALVAAVPCQDRAAAGASAPVAPPKQAQWAAAMSTLQERIVEEWRRRDKKGSSSGSSPATTGLLAEMQAVERAARDLNSLLEEIAEEEEASDVDAVVTVGVSEERAADVVERAQALDLACRALEDGIAPLERQVRAVFHRIVASRGEVVRCIEHSARSPGANAAGPASAGLPPPHHHSF